MCVYAEFNKQYQNSRYIFMQYELLQENIFLFQQNEPTMHLSL